MRVIYCLVNTVNSKKYIGQTKDLKRRLKGHFNDFRGDTLLTRAVKKYGSESFQASVIEECADEDADDRERFWIAAYRSTDHSLGYNCEAGGQACKEISTETRAKISSARKAWFASLTPEQREQYRQSKRGRTPSDASRQARREKMTGRKQTDEHRNKIAAAHRGKKYAVGSDWHKAHARKKIISDDLVLEMKVLLSAGMHLTELCEKFNVKMTTLRRALFGESASLRRQTSQLDRASDCSLPIQNI